MVMVVVWSVDKEDGGLSVEGLFEPATKQRLTVAAARPPLLVLATLQARKKLKTITFYVLFEKYH